jgi:hypothetical protein
VLSLGLSSILDFVDEAPEGQQSLFEPSEWHWLRSYSKDKFGCKEFELPNELVCVWEHVVKVKEWN